MKFGLHMFRTFLSCARFSPVHSDNVGEKLGSGHAIGMSYLLSGHHRIFPHSRQPGRGSRESTESNLHTNGRLAWGRPHNRSQ